VVDAYTVESQTELRYNFDLHGYSFDMLSGLGISAEDYAVSGSQLTISNEYLKYFYTPGNYELTASVSLNFAVETLPIVFSVISPNASKQIINGGFETGDFFGWNGYPLWKDEHGLFSYQNERVVSAENYGSSNTNPYNRDGQYHLGVYASPYDNANKDLNQERMGILRSSDFILSGSGWISFKLGGGQNPGAAYLSVKESGTHQEVARFANRHFNDTSVSHTANAEAYLFPYYADLSPYLGHSLYLSLVDAASHEWNVLAADSFITYYPSAPSTTSDTLAQDIKPHVAIPETLPNGIANDLTTGIAGWEDPQGILQWSDSRARTNKTTGDAALGVIRSPAFRIDPLANHLITWEWEGSLASDKQLFMLVKEAGTNQEVLRLTRRENLATKIGGGLDKHFYDLAELDPEKGYYLEFVDNSKSGWGLISVRNVALVNASDSRVQVPTDQAVNTFEGLRLVNLTNGHHRQSIKTMDYVASTAAFHVVSTFGEHPQSELNIHYQTYAPNTYIRYAPEGSSSFSTVTSHCEINTVIDDPGVRSCKAELRELSSGESYRYQVVEKGAPGTVYRFTTPSSNSPLHLAFFADSQATSRGGAQVYRDLLEQAQKSDPNLSFGLQAGDLVENGSTSDMWEWYFEAATSFNTLPMMTLPGNHDFYAPGDVMDANSYYESYFANPDNGPNGLSTSSYYFETHDTLFIMLDTVKDTYGQAQIAWFNQVVASHPSTFIVVSMHYSAYGAIHTTTASELRAIWGPVFDSANVDLVLSGHDHVYARTPAMKNNAVAPLGEGTVYLSGGSASQKIYAVDPSVQAQYSYFYPGSENLFSLLTISETSIVINAVDLQGQAVDSFTLLAKNR